MLFQKLKRTGPEVVYAICLAQNTITDRQPVSWSTTSSGQYTRGLAVLSPAVVGDIKVAGIAAEAATSDTYFRVQVYGRIDNALTDGGVAQSDTLKTSDGGRLITGTEGAQVLGCVGWAFAADVSDQCEIMIRCM